MEDDSLKLAYKALSKIDGRYYSIGMGGAEIIEFPFNGWVSDTGHGLNATRTRSGAKGVIASAKRRKVLPIPENMVIGIIVGRDIMLENSWRYVFREICLVGEVTTTNITWEGENKTPNAR